MFDINHIRDFAYQFLSILFEGLPYIFIGTLISGFIDVYLPSGVLERFLPKRKWLSILVCGLMGLVMPVCECTVVPVIRRLVAKGLPVGSAFAYMLAAPIVNPITFFSTWTAFQGDANMALSRMAIGYLVAVVVGMIIIFFPIEAVLRKSVIARLSFSGKGHSEDLAEVSCCGHDHSTDDHSHSCASSEHDHPSSCCSEEASSCGDSDHHHHDEEGCCGHDHTHSSGDDKLVGALRVSVKDFMDVTVYFTIGVMLMVIFNTVAGEKGFLQYIAQDDKLLEGTAFMMGLSFVLSLCSTSDAFLVATSFQGFGRIPKMAFLVYGPMMDVKLIFLYQTLMKTKAVAILAVGLFVLVGALCMFWGQYYEAIQGFLVWCGLVEGGVA